MARPKKKISNPAQSMEQLLNKAVEAFVEPYDDRDERDSSLPSLRAVTDELDTTILRVRKLLITANFYSTETSRTVQELVADGKSIEEIMKITHLKRASINSYLPYKNMAFNLDQTTVNADRHRVFRRRVKAVAELSTHVGLPDEMNYLWKAIIAFEDYPFKTSGRGSREGTRFKYEVSREPGKGGHHYSGASEDGYGNELWITVNGEKREKSISRSTVELGYKRARELGVVRGSKALGLPGAGSYLWPVYFIVRIAWVFGLNGKNFIKTMINVGKTHDIVRVVNDQIGTPTYTMDLARLLVDMIETEKYGYYHATNEGGYISWYDFCCEFYRQYGLGTKVIPVTTA